MTVIQNQSQLQSQVPVIHSYVNVYLVFEFINFFCAFQQKSHQKFYRQSSEWWLFKMFVEEAPMWVEHSWGEYFLQHHDSSSQAIIIVIVIIITIMIIITSIIFFSNTSHNQVYGWVTLGEIYHLLHPWGEVSQGKTKSISTQKFIIFILRFRLFKVIFHFLNKNLVQKMQMPIPNIVLLHCSIGNI